MIRCRVKRVIYIISSSRHLLALNILSKAKVDQRMTMVTHNPKIKAYMHVMHAGCRDNINATNVAEWANDSPCQEYKSHFIYESTHCYSHP